MKIEFMPRVEAPKPTLEESLAKAMPPIAGGSPILLLLFFLMAAGAGTEASDLRAIAHPWVLKAFLVAALYIASMSLLGTLPGKSYRRRRISWLFSILFHAGLLGYLAFVQGWGAVALAVGFPELIVVALSCVGLALCIRGRRSGTGEHA